tara:strand:- start:889 stop:1143 length:255 start_codon:yes stop_codon:yes gene_type:complete
MENQQISAEEMAAKKQELIASFAEQSEMLIVQLKYETLIADIEEQRLRALVAQMRAAQILAPAPESPTEGPATPPAPRTLKKEK